MTKFDNFIPTRGNSLNANKLPMPVVVQTKDPDDVDIVREGWNPSEKTFAHFLTMDERLALSNIRFLLSSDHQAYSAREIKECTLHAMDTVERVLFNGVRDNLFALADGKYSWKIPVRN